MVPVTLASHAIIFARLSLASHANYNRHTQNMVPVTLASHATIIATLALASHADYIRHTQVVVPMTLRGACGGHYHT